MKDQFPILLRISGATIRHPRIVILLASICAVLSFFGARRIHPTGSIASLLPSSDPAAVALARITNEFGVLDDLIVLATVSNTDLPASQRMESLRSFAERLQHSIVESNSASELCSAVNYKEFPELREFIEREMVPAGLLYLDDESFGRIRTRLSTEGIRKQIHDNEDLISAPGSAGDALSKLILRDPLRLYEILADAARTRFNQSAHSGANDLLLSLDGSTLMIRLTGRSPASDLEFAKRLVDTVSDACQRSNLEGLKLEYTGSYAIAVEAERSIRRDMIHNIVGSVILLAGLFLLAYRGIFTFIIGMIPVGLGITCAFGVSSFYSTQLTPAVAVMGGVLASLAIDYPIHLISHYGNCRVRGMTTSDATAWIFANILPPMTIGCITSAVGFAAIIVSSVPALRQLAVLGTLGLFCSFLAALFLVPLFLHKLQRISYRDGQPRSLGATPLLKSVNANSLLWVGTCSVVLSASLLVFVLSPAQTFHSDDDLTVMHPRPNPPLDLQRSIAARFGRDPDPLIVHLRADTTDNLVSLAYQVDHRLQTKNANSVGISASFGPATLLPDPDRMLERRHAIRDLNANRVVSDFESAIDESLFNPDSYGDYRAFLSKFCDPIAIPNFATLLHYPTVARMILPRSSVDLGTMPTEAIVFLFFNQPLDTRAKRDDAIQAVRGAIDGLSGATLTGVPVISSDTEAVIGRELGRLLLVSLVIIAGCLFVYFGRFSNVLLALLPVLFAFGCLLGAMTLLHLHPNMVNMITVPLLLGTGVDHGIFLVKFAQDNHIEHGSRDTLVDKVVRGAHALMLTTLTTLLGFGTLVFTSTPAIRSLGLTVGIGMTACLSSAFFLLAPILFRRAEDWRFVSRAIDVP